MPNRIILSSLILTAAVLSAVPVSHAAIYRGSRAALALSSSHDGLLILAAARGGGGRAAAPRRAPGNLGQTRAVAGNFNAGSREIRSAANTNIGHNANFNRNGNFNNNANFNRNTNINNNVNVNRNVNVDRGYYGGWDDHYHPVAAAAAVTAATVATAAAVGSVVNTLPPSCSTVVNNGISYSQCGSTWYQPQFAGTSVQYTAVNPPF